MVPDQFKSAVHLDDDGNKVQVMLPVVVERDSDTKVNWRIEELNELLDSRGVHMSLSVNRQQGHRLGLRYTLFVNIDWDVMNRGAGRKKTPTDMTLQQALLLEQEGHKAEEIADMIGISRATYFRRKKAASALVLKGKSPETVCL